MRRLAVLALLLTGTAQAAAGKTNASASLLVNKLLRADSTALPASLTARLYTTCPSASSNGTELIGTGYTPPAITSNTTNWTAASSGQTTNGTAISFGTAGADWAGINCMGLESAGTVYVWGGLTGAPITVKSGEGASFTAGTLAIAEQNALTAQAPTFSPAAGSYVGAQTVTISSADGCSSYVYWNTTGNPTTSDTHGTSVTVALSETVYAKVIGCPGYADSATGSAAYTISGSITRDTTAHPTNQAIVASQAVGSATQVTTAAFGAGAGVWVTARVVWAAASSVGTPTISWQGTVPSGNGGWVAVQDATWATGTYAGWYRVQIFRCWCPNSFSGAQVQTVRGTGSGTADTLLVVDAWTGANSTQTSAASGNVGGGGSSGTAYTPSVTVTKTANSHLVAVAIDAGPPGPRLTPTVGSSAEAGSPYVDDHSNFGVLDTAYLTSNSVSGSQTVGFTETNTSTLAAAMEIVP